MVLPQRQKFAPTCILVMLLSHDPTVSSRGILQEAIILMMPEREPHARYSSDGAEYLRRLLGDRASVRER